MGIKTEDAFFEEELPQKRTFSTADAFEDAPQPVPATQSGGRNLLGLPDNIERAVFPTSGVQATGKREKDFSWGGLKQGAMAGLDALSLPVRALGSLQINPETGRNYEISDPESNVFRPWMNSIKKGIQNMPPPPVVTTDRQGAPLQFNPSGSFALQPDNSSLSKRVTSGAVELAGGMAGDPTVLLGPASKLLRFSGRQTNKALGRLSQELSGVSEETLRHYGTGFGKGAAELKAAAGTQKQIGERLLDALDNFDQYLPEKQIVDNAVQNMPDINVNNVVNKLNSAKTTGHLKASQQINTEIDDLVNDILNAADPNGNVPAKKFIEMRREIDDVIGDRFGKTTDKFIGAAKQARYQMALDLVNTAKQSGNQQYVDAMQSFSKKLQLSDDLKGYVGKSAQVRDKRVETFISTLFGKNKADRQRVVQGLSDVFGEDFLRESKLASMAAELGDEGVAGLLPRQLTVRSTLGPMLAGGGVAVGVGPAAIIPLALSSPRVAAGTLAAADATGNLFNLVNNATAGVVAPVKRLPGVAAALQNSTYRNNDKNKKVYNIGDVLKGGN